ncbi:MAG TPA: hypothetical protein VH761_10180, partial [Ilumatobacteraceae bacterium]
PGGHTTGGGPAGHVAGTGTGTGTGGAHGSPTGGPTGTGTGAGHTTGTGTGTGHGTGDAAHHDEPWRTADTMGGRFEGLGNALIGDIAHAEVGLFGSMLGFDEHFEQSIHDDIHPGRAGAGDAHAGAAGAHGTDAAHPGATHGADAAHGAAPTGGTAGGTTGHAGSAAHQSVDHIVSDPYALDELANRLYPNIRTRLRQELLIDRERAGLLADFR